MPRKLSREHEIELQDAAYHESAHAVVAHAVGFAYGICIRLWPRGTDRRPDEKLVAGNCAFAGRLSPKQGAIIGWAGEMAGWAYMDPDVLESLEAQDDALLAPSPSDQALIDQAGTGPKMKLKLRRDAWKVVCDNWPAISELAEQLISEYRQTRNVQHQVQPPSLSPRRRGR